MHGNLVHRTQLLARIFPFPSRSAQRPACFLTACVTRWWVGRDNAALTEPTPSHAKCLKTRRLPPVRCTLCWAQSPNVTYYGESRHIFLISKISAYNPHPAKIESIGTHLEMLFITSPVLVLFLSGNISRNSADSNIIAPARIMSGPVPKT